MRISDWSSDVCSSDLGIYYVNLIDMNQTQKVQVAAIAAHEGAPGHHFQIARQQELTGIPKFRKFGGSGAYIEGWGLYSERLANEMGLYTRIGRATSRARVCQYV